LSRIQYFRKEDIPGVTGSRFALLRRVHLVGGPADESLKFEYKADLVLEKSVVSAISWVSTNELFYIDNFGTARMDWELVEISEAEALSVEQSYRVDWDLRIPPELLLNGQRTDEQMSETKKWWQRGKG
jgi:hypothetical protein